MICVVMILYSSWLGVRVEKKFAESGSIQPQSGASHFHFNVRFIHLF